MLGRMKWFLKIFFVALCGLVAAAPKRKKQITEPEERLYSRACKRLKTNKQKVDEDLGDAITSLYKGNKLSAQDVGNLLDKADAAGVSFKNPMQNKRTASDGTEKPEMARDKNAARTMDRWLKRNSQWGNVYWAQVPIKKRPKSKETIQEWLPFLLPHEWLCEYWLQPGAWAEGMPEDGSFLAKELNKACESWGNEPGSMFPLGLFGDGVPIQGRMNQSTLDFFTLNLPGSPTYAQMRIPIVCLNAKNSAGWPTCLAISQVITWSLQCLGEGKYPSKRHDGTDWNVCEDKVRARKAGLSMPGKAALVQMRGDWDWNCKWYGSPQHNELKGMCWLCKATPTTWRKLTTCSDSRARDGLNKAEYLDLLKARDKDMNPLFSLPNVSNGTMKVDWMHTVDEGVGAFTAGQVLKELAKHHAGSTMDSRVEELWNSLEKIYKEKKVPAEKRLKKLTVLDISKAKKAPELDKKAAEVRYFCPHLVDLANEKSLHEGSIHDKAVQKAAKYCSLTYVHMETFNAKELVKAGRKLISQYMALEQEALDHDEEDTKTWRLKPKFHLFSHLLDEVAAGNHPRNTWNYKDETFAGTMQKLYASKGGNAKPGKAAEKLLLKWMSETDPLSISKASSSKGSRG